MPARRTHHDEDVELDLEPRPREMWRRCLEQAEWCEGILDGSIPARPRGPGTSDDDFRKKAEAYRAEAEMWREMIEKERS